ncbi:hypothetical protein H072_4672 [Dactylellina haptotyla CBS 200.50]|uniref:F-box domain-containing protein n=1 Tax=Dactylellina haptotyla (strain CBS 200.50) TaxID=1284197 RepID=S8AJY1_DACHA|nr:hypothetical protein H072_4672 [Dactylellina haptotyla CBS 200.50]
MPYPEPQAPDNGDERGSGTRLPPLPLEIHLEILSYLSFEDQTRAGLAYELWERILTTDKSVQQSRYSSGISTSFEISIGYSIYGRTSRTHRLVSGGITCVVEDGVIRQYKLGNLSDPSSGLVLVSQFPADDDEESSASSLRGSYLDVSIDIPPRSKFLDEPITLDLVSSNDLTSRIYRFLKPKDTNIDLLDHNGDTIPVREFLDRIVKEINNRLDANGFRGPSGFAYKVGIHFDEKRLNRWSVFVITRKDYNAEKPPSFAASVRLSFRAFRSNHFSLRRER